MKKLFTLLFISLFALQCEKGWLREILNPTVEGCNISTACNYNPDVNKFDDSCEYASCLDCSKRYELKPIKEAFLKDGTIPYCDSCGGIIKTATISFGQSMPEEGMQIAQRKTLTCDLFITIGTSLVVFPAAGFPKLAKDIGANLIIINNEPTDFDPIADLVIHEQIGKVFSEK